LGSHKGEHIRQHEIVTMVNRAGSIVQALIGCMKCLKEKAERVNRPRSAKSEGEVRIAVKSETCVRSESILEVHGVRMWWSTADCMR
jgi:glycerol-3-phosphate dehydrogenase